MVFQVLFHDFLFFLFFWIPFWQLFMDLYRLHLHGLFTVILCNLVVEAISMPSKFCTFNWRCSNNSSSETCSLLLFTHYIISNQCKVHGNSYFKSDMERDATESSTKRYWSPGPVVVAQQKHHHAQTVYFY